MLHRALDTRTIEEPPKACITQIARSSGRRNSTTVSRESTKSRMNRFTGPLSRCGR